jgi:hypothetical protein
VTLGVQDGSINGCDNSLGATTSSWYEHGGPIYPGYNPPLGASGTVQNSGAWFSDLNVHTVRLIVPWDIALPDTATHGRPSRTSLDPARSDATLGKYSAYHADSLDVLEMCFDEWLSYAAHARDTVEVDFGPDYDYRAISTSDDGATKNHVEAPTIAAYRAAAQDFINTYNSCSTRPTCYYAAVHKRGARVTLIAPWNEPDHANRATPEGNGLNALQPSNLEIWLPSGGSTMEEASCRSSAVSRCGPILAARMWQYVHSHCPRCIVYSDRPGISGVAGSGVIAGDFSSAGAVDGRHGSLYLRTYAHHLGSRPLIWALHPYSDTSDYEYCTANGDPYSGPCHAWIYGRHDVHLAKRGRRLQVDLICTTITAGPPTAVEPRLIHSTARRSRSSGYLLHSHR